MSTNKVSAFKCLLGVLGLVFTCLALPPSSQAETKALTPLVILTIPLPPWGYKDEQGNSTGICYDMANEIARRMKRPAINHIVPMARLFKSLEYGKADFSIMLRTPYSEKVTVPVDWTGVNLTTVIWPRKGIDIRALEDIHGIRMSMARGLKVGGAFEQHTDFKIMPADDYAQSIQHFKAGRVDAVVGTYESLVYNAKKLGLSPGVAFDTPFPLAYLEGWVQASNAFVQREGIEELRKVVREMVADGTFQRIYRQYSHPIQSMIKSERAG